MNWSRGFLRIWLVLSLLWVAGTFALHIDNSPKLLSSAEFYNYKGYEFFNARAFLIILGPPAGALLVGLTLAWIARGFRD